METIVAEISKNWEFNTSRIGRLISQEFEAVIDANKDRGYELHSWQFSRVGTDCYINETIIAVFTFTAGGVPSATS